jgi:hypothetical protein
MSRFKLVLLSVVTAVALSAITSASASAKPCKEAGSNRWVFCYDGGEEIGTPAQEILGVSHLSLLEGTIGTTAAKFHCPKDDFTAKLGLLGAVTGGLILFLGCTVIKPATGCTLNPTTIHAQFTGQLIGHPNAAEVEFTGSKNVGTKEFAALTIEGAACAIPGTFAVTGTQKCALPAFGTALVIHDIDCKKSGSGLKLGGNVASFSSLALVHLGSPHIGLAWSVDLGL